MNFYPRPQRRCSANVYERIYVAVMARAFFDGGDRALFAQVLTLARSVSPGTDVDLDKIRSFAASAGDTITYEDALDVIKSLAEAHIRKQRTLH